MTLDLSKNLLLFFNKHLVARGLESSCIERSEIVIEIHLELRIYKLFYSDCKE